jgi:hypothetical protein
MTAADITLVLGGARRTTIQKPVELLRDQRGIYGVGEVGVLDDKTTSYGPWGPDDPWRPDLLILRPDRFDESTARQAVLQKITGGFRHGMFSRTPEEQLRQIIHHEALKRAGLPWPPPDSFHERWWSKDEKQQGRNRAIYHGLRRLSLHVINTLIDQAIAASADADALMIARRFAFKHRENIYRAAACSRRALQLAAAFPMLALTIYSNHIVRPQRWPRGGDWIWQDPQHYRAAYHEYEAARKSAADLVERGVRLRDVAALLDVPMPLRQIKPGVAHLAGDFICRNPKLLAFMPATTARARTWLSVVEWEGGRFDGHGDDFAGWVARHVAEMPGRGRNEVRAFVGDIADWVRAGLPANPPRDYTQSRLQTDLLPERPGQRFVVRAFTPSMSLNTVTKLSADWHEAVASHMDGPDLAFPPPWFPAATIGDYQIVPIETADELYREGHSMRHCIGTYSDEVRSGRQYIYSIHRSGAQVATVALVRNGQTASLGEIRGPCNALPPSEIIAAMRRWLGKQPPLPPLGQAPPEIIANDCIADAALQVDDDAAEDIPF